MGVKEKESNPSIYELESDEPTKIRVCLATGFSSYSTLNGTEFFSGYPEPTRIPDDPYYDKVIFLEQNQTCPNATEEGTEPCHPLFEDVFETDEKINFLSLTVLGLRLLFLKSILFNVLMTIRALSS